MDKKGMTNEEKIICLEIETKSCNDMIESLKKKIEQMEETKNLFSEKECENAKYLGMIIEKMYENVGLLEKILLNLIDSINKAKKEMKFNSH